jgi:hypothetical protein
MKPTLIEIQNEYARRKGGPNCKADISLLDLAIEMGYEKEEFKRILMHAEQVSTHVSKSERRNRRREKRQAMMREKYQL